MKSEIQKHILKRLGLFAFWLAVTLFINYFKDADKPKDISELFFNSFFSVFFLLLISSIFLIYESGDLKKEGYLELCKINRAIGYTLLSVLIVLALVMIRGAILLF